MTKYDLYISAHAFAVKTLDIGTELELTQKIVDQAKAEKISAIDFDFWNSNVRSARQRMTQLKAQPADSVRAAKKK